MSGVLRLADAITKRIADTLPATNVAVIDAVAFRQLCRARHGERANDDKIGDLRCSITDHVFLPSLPEPWHTLALLTYGDERLTFLRGPLVDGRGPPHVVAALKVERRKLQTILLCPLQVSTALGSQAPSQASSAQPTAEA
eukprot:2192099-Pleurochrysis_carterae.AAC.1